jgi:hypothetical protein
MTQQANFKTIGRVAVGGGIVAAGACAVFAAAPAQAQWGGWGHNNNTTNTASPNVTPATTSNVTVPSYGNFPGQARQSGFGTPVTGCTASTCYVQRSTGIGPQVGSKIIVNGTTVTVPSSPTSSIPVVSSPTGTTILLPV